MGYENSGRRPKPTALKVLQGNPGKRRLNPAEPVPPKGEVVKPGTLSRAGGVVWDRTAPICLAMGTLTTADVEAFRTFCELQSTFDLAVSQKDEEGFAPLVPRPEGEDPSVFVIKVDAVLKLERETAAALRPYYEKFGLEPVSRARLTVPKKPDEPKSKWAGIQ